MDDKMLERLARRAAAHREYWAWVFERYETWGGLATGHLAEHLGLTPRDLLRLGLYLRPRAERFEQDLRETSADFKTDRAALAAIVRFVDALGAMPQPGAQNPAAGQPGFLAAARSRKSGARPRGGKNETSDDGNAKRGKA